MNCEEFNKDYFNYHDLMLSEEKRCEFEEHLVKCVYCQNKNKEYEKFFKEILSIRKTIKPSKDLWPAIKSRIQKKEINYFRNWKFIAIASIIIILFSSFFFFYKSIQNINKIYETLNHFDNVSKDYIKAKETLLKDLHSKENKMSKETIMEIENNLKIIDQAVNDIEIAIKKDPDNEKLVFMLAETYHKETSIILTTQELLSKINN